MDCPSLMFRSRGFSLIELAIALVIVMTLLTLGITAFTVQMENAAVSTTKKKQDVIKDALSAYLGRNKRLPCPDVLDAVGNVVGQGDDNRASPGNVTTQCSKDFGVIPYLDLGLPRDFALDGWENYFTYRVTTDADPTLDWTRSTNFAVGKPGKLLVSERNPATSATLSPLTGTENAVVVLVSHGKNGLGAWTVQGTRNVAPSALTNPDEAENADDNTNFLFIRRDITEINVTTYGAYDDIVTYMKASDLIAPLVKDGSLQTPEATTAQVMADVVSQIIGKSMSAAPTLPVTYPNPPIPNDGWGKALVYLPNATTIAISTSSGEAFRVTSYGPDRTSATTDDVVTTVTVDALKAIYAKAGITLPP